MVDVKAAAVGVHTAAEIATCVRDVLARESATVGSDVADEISHRGRSVIAGEAISVGVRAATEIARRVNTATAREDATAASPPNRGQRHLTHLTVRPALMKLKTNSERGLEQREGEQFRKTTCL